MPLLSMPPPKSLSRAALPVVMRLSCSLFLSSSSPLSKPMSSAWRAALMIFRATASLVPDASTSSDGLATAMLMRLSNPAALSFSAVAAPTPGRSVTVVSFLGCGVAIVIPRRLSQFL